MKIKRGCLGLGMVALILMTVAFGLILYQAKRTPAGIPEYVALGSSFAAGAGLGPLEERSPLLCARSVNGYPQQLARMLKVSIVDMSCGGAKAKHLLRGGQFFQGPQIRTIGSQTRLVTVTVGGNDILYIGDLSLLAARHSDTVWGWLVRRFWSGPKPVEARDWARLEGELLATMRAIRAKAPKARVVVVTYPTILPATGSCQRVALTAAEADMMRKVGDRFAAATRSAVAKGGAIVVDMHGLATAHNACSAAPWTFGYSGIAPFHPTLAGARATAKTIADALTHSPAGVAAVR